MKYEEGGNFEYRVCFTIKIKFRKSNSGNIMYFLFIQFGFVIIIIIIVLFKSVGWNYIDWKLKFISLNFEHRIRENFYILRKIWKGLNKDNIQYIIVSFKFN